jgi:hypothetical protein
MKAPHELQEFAPAELLINERTVRDETGDRLGCFRLPFDVVTSEEDLPSRGLENPHHDTNGRRLTRAIRSQEAEDLPSLNFQVEGIDGGEVAVVFGEVGQPDHLGSLDNRDFQVADELQNIHLAIDLSFEKLNVSGIGGKLIQYGIDGYPLADPDFGPGVIIKGAAKVDHADHRLRGNPGRPGNGVEKNGVLVAVALLGLQNFEGVGDAHRGFFGDFFVNPILDS